MSENQTVQQVLIVLRQIMRAVDIHSKKLEKTYHVTGPQMVVLKQIIENNQIPIGTLAKNVNLSNATITGIVDRLEKRGFVKRAKGPNDRRQVLIRATQSGQDILKSAPPLLQEQFMHRFEKLTSGEQKTILTALEQTASMMNAEDLEVGSILSGQPLSGGDKNPK